MESNETEIATPKVNTKDELILNIKLHLKIILKLNQV